MTLPQLIEKLQEECNKLTEEQKQRPLEGLIDWDEKGGITEVQIIPIEAGQKQLQFRYAEWEAYLEIILLGE